MIRRRLWACKARSLSVFAALLGMAVAPELSAQDCRGHPPSSCAAFGEYLQRARGADADSIWRDLRYVANSEEMQEWFRTPAGEARAAFLESFWRRRATRAALHPEERYGEHIRRLSVARAHYGIEHDHPRIIGAFGYEEWFGPLRTVLVPSGRNPAVYPLDLDDRGLFLLRYGEPDIVERCTGNVRPNPRHPEYFLNEAGEAWIYTPRVPEARPIILLFATRGRASEFELVFTPGQTLCDYDQLERLTHRLGEFDPAFLHASKDDLLSARGYLAALVPWHHTGTSLDVAEFSLDTGLSNATLAVDTALAASEMIPERYNERIKAVIEFLQFADYDSVSAAEVTLAIGLRASDMAVRDRLPRLYTGRVVLTMMNVISGATMQMLDTLVALRPATPVSDSSLLGLYFLRTLPRGLYDFAVRVEPGVDASADSADKGSLDAGKADGWRGPDKGAVQTGRLDVAASSLTGRKILISSIAVGRPAGSSGWVREGRPLALMPNHNVPKDRRVALYYEVYGVTKADAVDTEITVQSLGERLLDRSRSLTLSFHESPQPNDLGWLVADRTLDVTRLAPGKYSLILRVTCKGMAAAERRTTLYIR